MRAQRESVCVILVLALALLYATPSKAEDHPRDRISVATFVAGTGFVFLSAADKIITYKAITSHRGREVGPILAPWVEAHGVKSAMIGGLALDMGQAVGMAYVAKRWPASRKAVLGGFIAANLVKTYVVVHNVHELRR